MEKQQQQLKQQEDGAVKLAANARHIGGVSSELGGVDPEVDQNLMRLSGGPD